MSRQCGDCQLCCKLLPVASLRKVANEKCKYQKFGVGCTVHNKQLMPVECSLWSCWWLKGPDADELARPDRSHIVIDCMPDTLQSINADTGETITVKAIQCWIDPKFPDAHKEPNFRKWVDKFGALGTLTTVRYNSMESLILISPSYSGLDHWIERKTVANVDLMTKTEKMLTEAIIKEYEDRNNIGG